MRKHIGYSNWFLSDSQHQIARVYLTKKEIEETGYEWAVSLGGDAALKLLGRLGLVDAAVNAAMERGAFDFALDLAKGGGSKEKMLEVQLAKAEALEDAGKVQEAEQAFVEAGQPKQAILMYFHLQDWDAALLVAEKYDPSSVPEVLLEQAKRSFEQRDWAKCESFLLRAQKPELAIKWYKEARMWKEALRFAKEYLPGKVAEIHDEIERVNVGRDDTSKEALSSHAKMLESQREYTKAIEAYLRVTSQHTSDSEYLEAQWFRAVDLASKNSPERLQDIVYEVGHRLEQLRRFQQAGELYESVDLYKPALDAFCEGNMWDRAKKLVAERAPDYRDYVEDKYRQHLKSVGHADALVNVDIEGGLKLYAEKGDWEKGLEKVLGVISAETDIVKRVQVEDLMHKFVSLYAKTLIESRHIVEGVRLMNRTGSPASAALFPIYARVTREVLYAGSDSSQAVGELRNMLFKLVLSFAKYINNLSWKTSLSVLK